MESMDVDIDESHSWHTTQPPEALSDVSEMDIDSSPQSVRPTATQQFEKISSLESPKIAEIRTKTGYGIPDDETSFSQFPEKGCAVQETSRVVHRRHKSSLHPRNAQSEPVLKTHRVEKKKSWCQSVCSLLRKVIVFVTIISVAMFSMQYLLHLQRQRCIASKQFNVKGLETDLESFVFGQHLASQIIPKKIDTYFKNLQDKSENFSPSVKDNGDTDSPQNLEPNLCKPLVLLFHGWTGVGKNFVANIITDIFPHTNVNHIVIPLHFPHQAMEHTYGKIIHDWIVSNNTACSVNIIVIDEMDKTFTPVTEGIISAIADLSYPCYQATPTIFLMLSNSYATAINQLFFNTITDNPSKGREAIPIALFQSLFSSIDEDAWDYVLDKDSLIDARIPFLPLEKRHVLQCIKRELVSKRFSTEAEAIEEILAELTFSSSSGLEVSVTGCKRVADKVDYIMLSQL